ncbi:signal peptidase II [Nocardia nova]|uniref:signal peptidase II n=1 Tax=Nocardia nova TaxID=37330 RepID=UPI0037997D52
MTAAAHTVSAATAWKRRLLWAGVAVAIAAADLAVKTWAVATLDNEAIEAGPVDLRLAYNPGAAFSLAANAPGMLILAVTTTITVVVAAAGWWFAPRVSPWVRAGSAAVLGGAAANVIDRVPDGLVTDYLHTGWWPTFNLADTSIVLGAATLALSTLLAKPDER